MDEVNLAEKISIIKRRLDSFSGIDHRNFLPLFLKELRNYIFQLHAVYEEMMHGILARHYFKSGLKPVDTEILFENLTFSEKIKIVNVLKPNFPSKSAEQLNGMRNRFAH